MLDVTFTGNTIERNGEIFREIEVEWGYDVMTVSMALKDLNNKGYNAYVKFNDKILFSDEDGDLDHAYLKVVGETYDAFEKKKEVFFERIIREEEEFIKQKQSLIEEYIKKGHEILDEKYWEKWDEITPIRVSDIYHGMELSNGLEIIEALNEDKSFEECKSLFSDEHSGMSYGLTAAVVAEFADRGKEFYNYIYKKE